MTGISDIIIQKIIEIQHAIDAWLDKLPSSMEPYVDILKSPVALPFTVNLPFELRVLTAIFGIFFLIFFVIIIIITIGMFHPSKTTLMKWENKKVSKEYEKQKRKEELKAFRIYKKSKYNNTESGGISSSVNNEDISLNDAEPPEETLSEDDNNTSQESIDDIAADDMDGVREDCKEQDPNTRNDKEDINIKDNKMTKDLRQESKEETITAENAETINLAKLTPKEYKKAKKEQEKKDKQERKERLKQEKADKKKNKTKTKDKPIRDKPKMKSFALAKKEDYGETFVPSKTRSKNRFDYLDDLLENAPTIKLEKDGESLIEKTITIDTPEKDTIDADENNKSDEEIITKTAKEKAQIEVNEEIIEKIEEKTDKEKPEENREETAEIITDDTNAIEEIRDEAEENTQEDTTEEIAEEITEEIAEEIAEEIIQEAKEDKIIIPEMEFDDISDFFSGVEEKKEDNPPLENSVEERKEPTAETKTVEDKTEEKKVKQNSERKAEHKGEKKKEAINKEIEEIKVIEDTPIETEPFDENSASINGQFEIINIDDKFRFVLTSDTDQPLYTSRDYKTMTTCMNGVQTFKKNVLTGDFVVAKDKFGSCKFILTSKSSHLVKYDGELFRTEEECLENIDKVKQFSETAHVIVRI